MVQNKQKTRDWYFELVKKPCTTTDFYLEIEKIIQEKEYFFLPHLEYLEYLESLGAFSQYNYLLDETWILFEQFISELKNTELYLYTEDYFFLKKIISRKVKKERSWIKKLSLQSYFLLLWSNKLTPSQEGKKEKDCYLKKITTVDIQKVKKELAAIQPEDWFSNPLRAITYRVQSKTFSIVLKKRVGENQMQSLVSGQYSQWTPKIDSFPELKKIVMKMEKQIGGRLGRVVLAKLPPKSIIYTHFDSQVFLKGFDRYHLVVNAVKGKNHMYAGGERKSYSEGEIFWINNFIMHKVYNDSDKERIHVIFDIRKDT